MYGFLQHVTDIQDSQLHSGTSWHGDLKEGSFLHSPRYVHVIFAWNE